MQNGCASIARLSAGYVAHIQSLHFDKHLVPGTPLQAFDLLLFPVYAYCNDIVFFVTD